MSRRVQTRVEVYQDRRGGWRWRAKAANGEVLVPSEAYTRKWNAKRAARRVFPLAPISDA